jgi:hypothetical protein
MEEIGSDKNEYIFNVKSLLLQITSIQWVNFDTLTKRLHPYSKERSF